MAAYDINTFDGSLITTIQDGTDDRTTNLVLIGKNFTGYGEFIAENFVKLLENFARNTSPGSQPNEGTPITGQLWYCKDSTSAASGLNVYDGTRFVPLPRYFKATTAPINAIDGDLWWHRTDKQLFGYNGTEWILIGPTSKVLQGKTGIYAEDMYDTADILHTVLSLYVKGTRIYITNKDGSFTPAANADVTGFTLIRTGMNANSNVASIRFAGISTGADNATTVGISELTESQLMRKDVTQTMATGAGLIINDPTFGLTISNGLELKTTATSTVIKNLTALKNLNLQNAAGTNAITIHQSSNYVGIFKGNPTKALDVTGDAAISGSLTAAGTLVANATGVFSTGVASITGNLTAAGTLIANTNGVYSNGEKTWTETSLTNLNQLTNGPGYLVNANVAAGYLGRIKDVWQTSSDGANRFLFSDNSATIFGSKTSTYIWKNNANATIATLLSNGNLDLGSGAVWTTTSGPNPLTNLNQLSNGPGYLTAADLNGANVISALGYDPAKRTGPQDITFQWNGAGTTPGVDIQLSANSNSTIIGNIAFTSDVSNKYLGRIKDVWQTSSDGQNRLLFSDNAATMFASASTFIWKNSSNTTVATMHTNGNLNLGGANAWTRSGGANPLTNLNQLTNGPGYITAGDVPSLGYTPVRQEGATVVKLGWNVNDLEAYSGSTNKGSLAFSSDLNTKLGRTVDIWQTSSDGNNRFYFNSNSSTVFGSKNGFIWKRSDSTSNAAVLSEAGTFTATGDVVAYSDAKLKTNVHTIKNALDTVQKLRGVTFTRIDDNRNSIGVIAQEVQKVLPEVVNNDGDTLGVAYGNMVGLLIEAIKEQQVQIDNLQNQINELKAK